MTAVLDPSPMGLSRLYDRERPPFRLTPKTMVAVGVVGALHLGIGLVIAHAYFALPPQDKPDNPIVLETFRIPPPKPPVDRAPPITQSHPPVETFIQHELPATVTPTDTEVAQVIPRVTGADVGVLPPPTYIDPPVPPQPPRVLPVINNPDWLSRPTSDQISKLYPARALDREVGGKAILMCEITQTGAVNNCDVVDETPKGYRFGEAAQAMTKYFKLSPRTVDGVSVAGSKVRIPIVFNAT